MKTARKPLDFDHIAVIYNPISTGNAAELAKKITKAIKNDDTIPVKATLTPTKRARHAEVLARDISLKYKKPLIISVSGDGGYNEVINGVMNATLRADTIGTVVGVIGAGNANDHRRVTRDEPLIALIRKNRPKKMDLLHIESKQKTSTYARFAHSYIGFGISPQVALRLNRHSLTKLRETQIVVKTLFTFKPLTIVRDGKHLRYDSLIFANINEMAKVLKFRDAPKLQDGKFEVIGFAHTGLAKLLTRFLGTATIGADSPPSYSSYSFVLPRRADVQLDGEVEKLPAGSRVTITSRRQAIDALY